MIHYGLTSQIDAIKIRDYRSDISSINDEITLIGNRRRIMDDVNSKEQVLILDYTISLENRINCLIISPDHTSTLITINDSLTSTNIKIDTRASDTNNNVNEINEILSTEYTNEM
jgi:hypothetical protein